MYLSKTKRKITIMQKEKEEGMVLKMVVGTRDNGYSKSGSCPDYMQHIQTPLIKALITHAHTTVSKLLLNT